MKKSAIILLCALLTAQTLTACGETVAESESDTESGSAVTESKALTDEEIKGQQKDAYYEALVPVVNLGAEIDIISGTWVDISAEEVTGQKFNDALYNRNLEIEERLGIKIVEHRYEDRQAVVNLVKNNVIAGDGTYDAISNMTQNAASLFVSNLLTDMGTVPNLQTDEAWWNQSANENFSFGSMKFCLISSLCQNADDVAAIMLFNKNMCINNNIELPYEDVLKGRWTYDRMWEMVEALPLDSNGDGAIDDRDIMGVVGTSTGRTGFHDCLRCEFL